MYNDKLVYKIVIWVFWGISLWKEKKALIKKSVHQDKTKWTPFILLGLLGVLVFVFRISIRSIRLLSVFGLGGI